MAKLIIVDSKQIKASLTRFKQLLAQEPAEQERLQQLQRRAQAEQGAELPEKRLAEPPATDDEATL